MNGKFWNLNEFHDTQLKPKSITKHCKRFERKRITESGFLLILLKIFCEFKIEIKLKAYTKKK